MWNMWEMCIGFFCGIMYRQYSTTISHKCRDINKIYREIRADNTAISSTLKTLKTIYNMQMTSLSKYFKRPHYVNNNQIIVEYYHNGKMQKILLNKRDHQQDIIFFQDEHGNEITNHIGPYLGQFNQSYTPSSLGYNRIIVYDSSFNQIHSYNHDEIIGICVS